MEHCGGGKGRAGTVAACLLLRFDQEGIKARLDAENAGKSCRSLRPRQPFMSCEEAIKEIRRRRPGSIETVCQETFVREYAQHLWRKAAAAEDLAARGLQFELSTIHQSSTKRRRMPKFILCWPVFLDRAKVPWRSFCHREVRRKSKNGLLRVQMIWVVSNVLKL